MRFSARVGVYLSSMDDRYPSTDEHQSVHLEFDFLVGVGRWTNRVIAYAHVLATNRYPPFRLAP
jgi:hypothetical protein